MYYKGNYLVSVENNVDGIAQCDGHTDAKHPIPEHQYVLFKSAEIDGSVTDNPLLSDSDTSSHMAT